MNAREKKMLQLLRLIRDEAVFNKEAVYYNVKFSSVFFDTVLNSLVLQFDRDLKIEETPIEQRRSDPCSV